MKKVSEKNNSTKKNHQNLKIKEKGFTKLHFIILFSFIISIGLILRVYYLPIEIPITLDGLYFFWYANDIALSGTLPSDYSPANIGWPIFLSIFFHILDSNNFMDYMVLQRLVTVVLSILTIIPVYFLCKKFFSEKFALVGSAIFAFEPRIIQNSIYGVTEPLFIILLTTAIVCMLNKQKYIIFLAFPLISFATIVRSEAIIMIIPFTIIYIIKFKNSKKVIYEIPILILVFILIIIPVSAYKTDVTGTDLIFSRIPNLETDANKPIEMQNNPQTLKEIENISIITGWAFIPIFIFFIPYGIFKIFKERKIENISIITILFFMSIPAIYAISFLPDTKYLYVLYPILCIVSLFSIKKFVNLFSKKNLVLITLVSFILIASISFLEIKKIDVEHENEALEIAKIVSKETKKINQFAMESGYLPIVGMNELKKFPITTNQFVRENTNMKYCFNIHNCDHIFQVKSDNIIEFLKNTEKKGITHLIIDDKEKRRAEFVNDVFQNEDKFPFLIKTYDSKEDGFSYHVKIFEINFKEFNKLN